MSAQRLANGDVYRYDYIFDSMHHVMETIVTLPSGQTRQFSLTNGIPVGEK
ncbi:MAG TPA: hypothetical protein VN950_26325 [Terriglobales bacterium]|nr:hypothetical protein [Terriglobales bacterium]